jgi:hypothetical protein
MTGEECPEDTAAWFHEINRHCSPTEHVLLRAVIYTYHCSSLCSRIRRIVTAGTADDILSNVPSILQRMGEVEKITWPLTDEKKITDCHIYAPLETIPDLATDMPDVCISNYQNSFRMRLSFDVLELILHASKAPSCTPQQQNVLQQYRWRCVQDFRASADKILFIFT